MFLYGQQLIIIELCNSLPHPFVGPINEFAFSVVFCGDNNYSSSTKQSSLLQDNSYEVSINILKYIVAVNINKFNLGWCF